MLFMREIQHEYAGQGAHKKYDVKPSMIKVELQIAKDLRDYCPILGRHVHPHEQDTRAKVHAHYLGKNQHNDVR